MPVLALGKISEVFVGRGVTRARSRWPPTTRTWPWWSTCCAAARRTATFDEGLLFTNLVDFDMVWGHRNDVDGFARGLEAVDAALPGIIAALAPG